MESFVKLIGTFVALTILSVYLYFIWAYGYWKRKGVVQIKPIFPMGSLENPLFIKRGFNGMLRNVYDEFKLKKVKFGGMYVMHMPVFVPMDPDLIKNMLTKDFQHFVNHGNFVDEKNDPLSGNLLNLEDDKWKNIRAKLTPTFTSGKMKIMFRTVLDCGYQMKEHIKSLCDEGRPLNIKEILNCYSTDIIGSCAFGVDCNSFKNPDTEFKRYGRKVLATDLLSAFRNLIMFVMPELSKGLKFKIVRKDVEDFFLSAVKDVVNHRKTGNVKRNDFIQLLLEMSDDNLKVGNSKLSLSMEEMAAQVFIFFLAGFETSGATLTFCFYELAFRPDIQRKLREEIAEVKTRYNGQLTYDGLMEMKYMQQVIDESLRKYPSIPFLNRKCSSSYMVPNTNIVVEKGTKVFISVIGLQMDPDYYPNPEIFDPERFSKENKSNRHSFTYLPFGDGPRVCIGMRFAIMQIKMCLALILPDFEILPHETTPKAVEFNPRSLVIMPKETILLRAKCN